LPNPSSAVFNYDGPIPLPPGGVTSGQACQRAVVPVNSAANLDSLATIPLRTTNPPQAVTLEVEAASGANPVFFTCDGLTTASAVGCLQVPVAPAFIRIPVPALLKIAGASGGISLFSVAGANVAVFYEWTAPSL
jgi:hypothetical protein